MVGEMYNDIFVGAKSAAVSPQITESMDKFQGRYSNLTFADRVEIITTEICSAGLRLPIRQVVSQTFNFHTSSFTNI